MVVMGASMALDLQLISQVETVQSVIHPARLIRPDKWETQYRNFRRKPSGFLV